MRKSELKAIAANGEVGPGHLPDNLTVEKIRLGNSIIRNPILFSYAAKGMLPYRGLGSGIKRALEAWPEIDFSMTVTAACSPQRFTEISEKG